MHRAVTTSPTSSVNNFFSNPADELLHPIPLTNRSKAFGGEPILESWHRDTSPFHHPSFRRANSPPKHSSRPVGMTSESNPSKQDTSAPSSDRPADTKNLSKRWIINDNGQFVDADAAATEWELADEIVRLKIGQVSSDAGDEENSPSSKLATVTVMQQTEPSPVEGSSDASADSPPTSSDPNVLHSRASSIDTSVSQDSVLSSNSPALLNPAQVGLHKVEAAGEVKGRPHSFSGGISSADLRRLQETETNFTTPTEDVQQPPRNMHSDRQYTPESQLTYPSLSQQQSTAIPRPQQQQQQQQQQSFEHRPIQAGLPRDDQQVDYNMRPRNFNPVQHGLGLNAAGAPSSPPYVSSRPANTVPALPYRQIPRGFQPQGPVPNAPGLGYASNHTAHLSLGNTQHLYDMMVPQLEGHHPAVARVQQQHNSFPRTHQHSASDPSALRDAATIALLNSNMPVFGPPSAGLFPGGMAPPSALYANQFYPPQDPYDVATAQAMAARLQSQYTGPYVMGQGMGADGIVPPGTPNGQNNGPSASNRKLGLYKTELCRSWEEKGTCRYGTKCQFAHGEDELRNVVRHPKYKTEICRTFWVSGSCPYGKRCCFIHTELPASGPGTTAENTASPQRSDRRERSMSTNSDPNDTSSSLLARISAKRTQESTTSTGSNTASTPTELNSSSNSNNYPLNSRPPTGSLRVDTSTLDTSAVKQNKSAYPSFASNPLLHTPQDRISVKSPVPVTAGPDLGRHTNARLEIVGYDQARLNKANPTVRHSFNGTDLDVNPNTPTTMSPGSFGMSSESNPTPTHVSRPSGHQRSGSAGNWGSISRSSHLSNSSFSTASTPPGDVMSATWSTSELAVGSSRLNEKAWT